MNQPKIIGEIPLSDLTEQKVEDFDFFDLLKIRLLEMDIDSGLIMEIPKGEHQHKYQTNVRSQLTKDKNWLPTGYRLSVLLHEEDKLLLMFNKGDRRKREPVPSSLEKIIAKRKAAMEKRIAEPKPNKEPKEPSEEELRKVLDSMGFASKRDSKLREINEQISELTHKLGVLKRSKPTNAMELTDKEMDEFVKQKKKDNKNLSRRLAKLKKERINLSQTSS